MHPKLHLHFTASVAYRVESPDIGVTTYISSMLCLWWSTTVQRLRQQKWASWRVTTSGFTLGPPAGATIGLWRECRPRPTMAYTVRICSITQ